MMPSSKTNQTPCIGVQVPRLYSKPDYLTTRYDDKAKKQLAVFGLVLDPWQELVLADSLGIGLGGKYAASTVTLLVPRRNGKNYALFARQILGMVNTSWNEEIQIHTAHDSKAARKHFEQLRHLIEQSSQKAKFKFNGGKGSERITYIPNGHYIDFAPRTNSGGRGLGAPVLYVDEALKLTDEHMRAIAYLTSSYSITGNPQIWYTSSAGDLASDVLARIRNVGITGEDPTMAFFEWSAEDGSDPLDQRQIAIANPSYGIRLSHDRVVKELTESGPTAFAIERLGIWPEGTVQTVFPPSQWAALAREGLEKPDRAIVAYDISPDRLWCSVAVSWEHDRELAVRLVHHGPVAELGNVLTLLLNNMTVTDFVADDNASVRTSVPLLQARHIKTTLIPSNEVPVACGTFFDSVRDSRLIHDGNADLTASVTSIQKRKLYGGMAWSAPEETKDATPINAATFAYYKQSQLVTVDATKPPEQPVRHMRLPKR